ncbi:MAG: hypothetical protein WBO36_10765, partial [Saprospiraceae bacterium]
MRVIIFLIFISFSHTGYSANYYWIGGTGNWNDISHWSTSSGGSVTYPVIPSATDDVFFDNNSFTSAGQTITISDDIAYTKNLSFATVVNNPSFRVNANVTLQIYGSLTYTTNMTVIFLGNINLLSNTPNNNVNFLRHNACNNLTFDGSGSWSLQGDIIVRDNIFINSGTVDFGSSVVICRSLKSKTTQTKNVNFGDSKWAIIGESDDKGYLGDEGNYYSIEIDAANWTSQANGAVFDLSHPTAKIYIKSMGTITLGSVIASASSGTFEILNLWDA